MTGYKGSIPERLSHSEARMGRVHISNLFWKSWTLCPPVQKPASLMVWGCVSAHGMGNLHICEGTINAERYIQVLEQHMLPSKQRLFQGCPCLFQQDNAKPHSARVTTAWLRSKRVLDWPACSPNLSPIENVWHIMKRKIRQWRPRTVEQLKLYIKQEWERNSTFKASAISVISSQMLIECC
uniref:Tc1-like transposase DDE domain-containing protein n=1 Tax=Pygocentrus nattereri TaxID=42514 RepID=A0AAR2IMB0_PYGNA